MRHAVLSFAFLLVLFSAENSAAMRVHYNGRQSAAISVTSRPVSTLKDRLDRAALRFTAAIACLLPPALQPPPSEDCAGAPVNKMASIALYCGIGGYLLFWPLLPVALVTGIIALNQIRDSGECGKGRAIAGIVLGGAPFAIAIVVFAWINGQ